MVLAAPAPAGADESPYCRKVRARAASEITLLRAPSVQVQGIKFPASGIIDVGATGDGFQLRAGLTLSAVDVYKSFQVVRAAEADCRQHEALEEAQLVLLGSDDAGKLPALRRQAEHLDAQRPTWQKIGADADERVARHITPLLDAHEIHGRLAVLERKRVAVATDIERLESRGDPAPSRPAAELAAAAEQSAMRYERVESHLRTVDAWNVTVTGGVIPFAGILDYYGILQLSFNLGGTVRYSRERRYLDERQRELRTARYEVADQARRFQDHLTRAAALARRDLAIVEEQLVSLGRTRAALESADARNAPHALALVSLDALALEADRVYLAALLDQLVALSGAPLPPVTPPSASQGARATGLATWASTP